MTLDKNKDGEITLDEITSMIKERQKQGGGGRGFGFRRSGGGRHGQHADGPGKHSDPKPADHKAAGGKDQASIK